MKLTVVGCGDAFGSGGRLQTCYLVDAAAGRFLIDCGATALIGCNRLGIDPNSDPDHLHLPPARRPLRRAGVVAGPRPARRQAHRAADRRRARGHRGALHRRRPRRCFRAPAACSATLRPDVSRAAARDAAGGRRRARDAFEVQASLRRAPYALRFEVDGKVLSFTGDTRMGREPRAGGPRRRPLHHGVLPVRRRAALST